MTRRAAIAAFAAAAVTAAATLSATHQSQQPVFRAGIDVVQVDASVLDKNRRPVRGLPADAFRVLENGVPQTIVAFAPVDVPEPDPVATGWMRDVAPDVRSNDLGDGRLFAIVMDDATIPNDPRLVNKARAIARDVISRLGPADLAAVIFTRDNRHAVDFTSDRTRLLEAVGRLSPGFAYAGQRLEDENYWFFSAIRTLGQVSAYLRTVPQRRKAIVYVSTGVPVDTEAASQAVAIGADTGSLIERDVATELQRNAQETFTAAIRDTLLRAQHGNVNIYAIDPSGVGGLNFYFQNQTVLPADPFQQSVQQRGLLGGLQLSRLNQEFLQTISENSGGRALINTNTFDDGIAQIFRENSSYYLIGYQSTRPREDRTVRRVEVRVNRADVEVRTRSAYFNDQAVLLSPDATLALRLNNALAGILPSPDIEMRAAVAPFAVPGRAEAAVAVAVGLHQPAPAGPPDSEVGETLELLTSIFTVTGDPRDSVRRTVRLTARAGEELTYDVLTRLDLPPGRYQLRLAAESEMLGKSGSVYFDLEIPDFAKEPVALSGVLLSESGGPPSFPAGEFKALAPFDPTSRRVFDRTDLVRAFFQVYQGGTGRLQPVELSIRITDGRDTVVTRESESLAADMFATDRGADYGFELPLTRLQPGRHLLTVEVTRGGRSAKRDIPFEVR